jgi:hypothetical protein
MEARNRFQGSGYLSYRPASLLRLAESIPWNKILGSIKVKKSGSELNIFMGVRNRVETELSYRPDSLCSLAGRNENPIPIRFLAPIDSSKIPAQKKADPDAALIHQNLQ